MKKSDLLAGAQFSQLTVLCKSPKRSKTGKSYYMCLCSCGTEKTISRSELISGKTKSCGCLRRALPSFTRKGLNGNAAFSILYSRIKRAARLRNIPFELTREQHEDVVTKICDYCGSPPRIFNPYVSVESHKQYDFRSNLCIDDAWVKINGVDRIDSTLGYTVTNCAPCCKVCNYFKRHYTKDFFVQHCERVAMYSRKKNEA